MPKAPFSQPEMGTKPYIRSDGETTPPPKPKKASSGSPTKKPSDSPKKAQGWSLEDKQTLLLAVLATAKPDFAAIAKDKFAHQGRNANQVSARVAYEWSPMSVILMAVFPTSCRSTVNGGSSVMLRSILGTRYLTESASNRQSILKNLEKNGTL